MPKPISTDNASFQKLREKGCLYVDKTAYFHQLLAGADARFFLARPRRFGKSLMISTFKAIFEARKELFGDLAIAKTDWKWEKYPVIYFNLGFAAGSLEEFKVNFPRTGGRSGSWGSASTATPASSPTPRRSG